MASLRVALRHRWFVLALLPLVGLVDAPALAQSGTQRIAAVVNDDVITTQDLNDRLSLALATSGLPNDAQTRQRLAPQVLRGFVDEKLQLQEATRLGMAVTEAEVDQAMETIAQRNKTNRADLTRYLVQQRAEPAHAARPAARPDRLDQDRQPRDPAAYRRDPGADRPRRSSAAGPRANDPELLLSELAAAGLRSRAGGERAGRRGRPGRDAARRRRFRARSPDRSRPRPVPSNGGDLGWVRAAAITPELRAQIQALEVGEISDPIVSPAGVHIFQLRDQRAAQRGGTPRSASRSARRIEQEQFERQASRYLRGLRRDAFVDVRL